MSYGAMSKTSKQRLTSTFPQCFHGRHPRRLPSGVKAEELAHGNSHHHRHKRSRGLNASIELRIQPFCIRVPIKEEEVR